MSKKKIVGIIASSIIGGTAIVTWIMKKKAKKTTYKAESIEAIPTRKMGFYEKYVKKAETISNVIFGGRLGEYKYYDMDKVIASALALVEKELA